MEENKDAEAYMSQDQSQLYNIEIKTHIFRFIGEDRTRISIYKI